MKRLFDVQISLLIMAEDRNDAIETARKYLKGDSCIDYNFMIHGAEVDLSFKSLKALRLYQTLKGKNGHPTISKRQ